MLILPALAFLGFLAALLLARSARPAAALAAHGTLPLLLLLAEIWLVLACVGQPPTAFAVSGAAALAGWAALAWLERETEREVGGRTADASASTGD